jgi:hypothetical protein
MNREGGRRNSRGQGSGINLGVRLKDRGKQKLNYDSCFSGPRFGSGGVPKKKAKILSTLPQGFIATCENCFQLSLFHTQPGVLTKVHSKNTLHHQ